ncbi:poly(glycerol-phosphate) alpha-glucosyltransferase [Salinicoccus hispanicus]|uniref:Poly(Glycerol-phosphate) alpha-glucosyltransferase n=1 Tax=Salinicoccus hispanicus TaxID=157225 RepID=A0A6N8TYM5_9STAP|nr:poly(glycerol-phosphate) alpha-glucosyltransferase [Salinicoccus hispanicus]MXQ51108.1 poly(glycerol-phosphate) alpha-glucosyltransferase [Salinicoccus hispanicus]
MNIRLIEDLRNRKDLLTSDWIIISLGFKNRRAHVFKVKNNNFFQKKINDEMKKLSDLGHSTEWLKADFIVSEEEAPFSEVLDDMQQTRRNYIDYGIAYDKNYSLAFLPEEINANAFVRPVPNDKDKKMFVSEKNINTYLKKYKAYKGIYFHKKYLNKSVIRFQTKGFLVEVDKMFELNSGGNMHGIRKIGGHQKKSEYRRLIQTATNYLKDQIDTDGRYEYGKFPHFDKRIAFYNVLRHTSTTYSLLEGIEFLNDKKGIEWAKLTIDYLLDNYLYIDPEEPESAYIFDDTNNINEVKLGQNGVALITLTKYMMMTGSDEYMGVARKIANGTLRMIGEDGDTVHVLNYPNLTVKEEKRVIYYDGEAAFGLMRLYQMDENPKWLETVELLFDHFIANDYWKNSDHWLSYCTYELTKVKPEEEYFVFGLKNVSRRLDFIYQRETTFPTFLEMLMAGYKMVELMKEKGMNDLIGEHLNKDKFEKTIEKRVDYQRTGYFYPEIAMYFKNPGSILGSFFIKHHGYRVRIDDIQHYISGYIQYMEFYKNNKKVT